MRSECVAAAPRQSDADFGKDDSGPLQTRSNGYPDVASVFTDLARKANSLARKMKTSDRLMGWLYRSTRYEALPVFRSERRRLARESLAMQHIEASPTR
jgi:hypothetical protein